LSVPLAAGWADNPSAVLAPAPATPIAVAAVTVTPVATGKIEVLVTGEIVNPNGAPSIAVLWLTHTGGPLPFPGDYQALNMPLQGVGEGSNNTESFACVVRYDLAAVNDLPLVFPIGVPVTFTLRLEADAADVQLPAHAAQVSVHEVR
jgi:hypothetical protein